MPAQQLKDAKGPGMMPVMMGKKQPPQPIIPYNRSSQLLISDKSRNGVYVPYRPKGHGADSGGVDDDELSPKTPHYITRQQWTTVVVLFFVNLINYMDRLTIAGILTKIQKEYEIGDAEGGALQTAFVVSYMVFAPIFGYLGDRHSRKAIMAFGVMLWTIFTVVGSFMTDYKWFLICRAMVGVGEASYSTIAPTIISDMFVKDVRSKMLAFFYFAIPVGSGLGYVVGSETTNLFDGDWRWGLRVTPLLGVVAVVLILFYMTDPKRGESEGQGGELQPTTYAQDLRSLARNRSFMLSTVAFTCVAFCTGALSWWGPKFIEAAVASQAAMQGDTDSSIAVGNVALVFGIVTMLSGIVGVPLGSLLSTKLKAKYPRADPLICASGLLLSAVFLAIGMVTANTNIYLAFLALFLGEVALNLNWSIVADILLYVVVPTRRSTAEAVQILISHALGDAGSPYLIGIVSDMLRRQLPSALCVDGGDGDAFSAAASDQLVSPDLDLGAYSNRTLCDISVDYASMQYSLFINNLVEVIGGMFFLLTAIYIVRDKSKCERYCADRLSTVSSEKPEFTLMLAHGSSGNLKGENDSISTDDDDDAIPQLQLILPPTQTV